MPPAGPGGEAGDVEHQLGVGGASSKPRPPTTTSVSIGPRIEERGPTTTTRPPSTPPIGKGSHPDVVLGPTGEGVALREHRGRTREVERLGAVVGDDHDRPGTGDARVRDRREPVLAAIRPTIAHSGHAIAFALYDRFTALDIVGPSGAGRAPRRRVRLRGRHARAGARPHGRAVDGGHRLLRQGRRPRHVVVPGGLADGDATPDDPMVERIRAVHPRPRGPPRCAPARSTSALAGLLDGVDAACHWSDLEPLGELGAVPTSERW